MGNKYHVTVPKTALSTTNDLLTIISGSSRRIKIFEIIVGGMDTTSAANSLRVQRATTGTTPGGAVTPEKDVTDQPTANFTTATTWSAQPSLSGTPLLRIPVNGNGGAFRWVARPGEEIEARNGEVICFRSEVGTSNVVLTVGVDEN